MRVHCVGFVAAELREIQDGSAFRAAADFCAWESTLVIRCEQTGQQLQVSCAASSRAHNAVRFAAEWERKNGKL